MMTTQARATAAPSTQTRRRERSKTAEIERDRTLGSPLPSSQLQQRRETLDEQQRPPTTFGRALVLLSRSCCPDCSGTLVEFAAEQLPLLRHGGYGEAHRVVRRVCCGCGWLLIVEEGAVKP